MSKFYFTIIFFITCFGTNGQEEKTTLYDANGKVTQDPLKVKVIQKQLKKNDSIWIFKRYRRNNQLAAYWLSKTENGKNKTGPLITFDKNDSISSVLNYNHKGSKHGKFSSWFDNRNIAYEGRYFNGKKVGVWRHYYYSGEIAAKAFFKYDSLVSQKYYDKKGNEKKLKEDCCKKKAEFKGGIKKYRRVVQKFVKKLDYNIKGTITVDYTIGIKGNLYNINIYDVIPEFLNNEIVHFFENIDGWSPAFVAGRAVPVQHSFKLIFQ